MRAHKVLESGFSLPELLLSISILMILFLACTPSTTAITKKNQMEVLSHDIISAINFCKVQALATGNELMLTSLSGTKNWSAGMVLAINNTKHICASDTKILRQWHWCAVDILVLWRGFQSQNYLIFRPNIANFSLNGSFIISTHSDKYIKLTINRFGRIRVEHKVDG